MLGQIGRGQTKRGPFENPLLFFYRLQSPSSCIHYLRRGCTNSSSGCFSLHPFAHVIIRRGPSLLISRPLAFISFFALRFLHLPS